MNVCMYACMHACMHILHDGYANSNLIPGLHPKKTNVKVLPPTKAMPFAIPRLFRMQRWSSYKSPRLVEVFSPDSLADDFVWSNKSPPWPPCSSTLLNVWTKNTCVWNLEIMLYRWIRIYLKPYFNTFKNILLLKPFVHPLRFFKATFHPHISKNVTCMCSNKLKAIIHSADFSPHISHISHWDDPLTFGGFQPHLKKKH